MIRWHTVAGFDALDVTTGPIALTMLPQLGGKLIRLQDLRTGREWLWQNPRLPHRRVPPGTSYSLADSGGWDECFPTVAACHYPAAPWPALPDHGELWSQPAQLDLVQQPDRTLLRTRWQGSALPYIFERTITLQPESSRLRFDYLLSNQADRELIGIWSAHPLLAIEQGMQLRLPPEARLHCWLSLPAELRIDRHQLSHPPELRLGERRIDLSRLPDGAAGIAIKLWSDPLQDGWASLHASDGALHFVWDATHLPQVAYWLNLGAYAGDGGPPYTNLGLEPCIGAQDSLAEAVERQQPFLLLPPHGTHSWWLEVMLAPQSP